VELIRPRNPCVKKGGLAWLGLNYRWIYVRQVGCAQAFRSGMTGVRMVSFSSWVGGLGTKVAIPA
jgi:hypothetical protein